MNTSYVQNIIDSCFEKMRVSGSRYYSTTTEQYVRKELSIRFTTRLRTTAGRCRYFKGSRAHSILASRFIIELGVLFLSKTDPNEHFQLVSHELAHAYHAAIVGDSDHGDMWKAIHRAMGGAAERCHDVDVPKNRVMRYVIQSTVDNKTYKLSTRRFNQLREMNLIGNGCKYKLIESYVKA